MGIIALIGIIVFIGFALIPLFKVLNQMQYKDLKEITEKTNIEFDRNSVLFLVLVAAIIIATTFLANYFILVKVNIRYVGIIILAFIVLLMVVNASYERLKISVRMVLKINRNVTIVLLVILLGYALFGGRTYFHAEAYTELLTVEEDVFNTDVETVELESLPIVDKTYGAKLGALKLGEFPGIGSEFEPGGYSDILYQGKQYMVSPLEYRGIFKWLNNRTVGTPGYILIDKVTSETKLINLTDQEGLGLKYVPSGYFGDDLVRHAYYNGMHAYRLEDYYFEIDEDGRPYYVMQYSLPTIFVNGGHDIARIALVDAITGAVNDYAPEDVPDWVESVYPPGLLLEQLNYWGSLQDGFLNRYFAQRGVLVSSQGKRTIMNDDGLYYFTGLTSAGGDESTIGFVYMNIRTKETKLYKFAGATEAAAMNKTLTLLPQNNIAATFPVPLNVMDKPTYYILIKGEDGRILRHVFMNVQDLEISGMANTKNNAYNAYVLNLGETDSNAFDTVEGTITHLDSYVIEGNTIFWVEIDDGLIYSLNVQQFDIEEMRDFMTKRVGDDIKFYAQNQRIVRFADA
jgi:hypothetical protein